MREVAHGDRAVVREDCVGRGLPSSLASVQHRWQKDHGSDPGADPERESWVHEATEVEPPRRGMVVRWHERKCGGVDAAHRERKRSEVELTTQGHEAERYA